MTPGSGLQGSKALDAVKKGAMGYARNRAINLGMDEAYNAATGSEEGMPDPLREGAKKLMMEKGGLSEKQAELFKKLVPGTVDMMRKAPNLGVWENSLRHRERKIDYKGCDVLSN